MKKFLSLLLVSLVVFSGCQSAKKSEEAAVENGSEKKEINQKVVARVNGRPIYENSVRGKGFDEVITDEILYEVGLKRGVDKEIQEEVEEYQKRLILAKIKRPLILGTPKDKTITDEEIDKYYKDNEAKYTIVNLKEVSTRDKAAAEQIHRKALEGGDLEQIASEAGAQVKDLRYNRKHSHLFVGKPDGAISEVIAERSEFKVLKLVETKKIEPEKARQSIVYAIMALKRDEAVNQKAQELMKENNITVEILERPKDETN
ncbi:MAG: peptidyl-prolyl cis-trans isomerase [Deltaproteobacteria bacterium]